MSDISASDLATLHEVMFCANGWEPEARLIGNVCAGDIVSAINNVVTELDKSDDIIEQLKSEIERNAMPHALTWTTEPPKVAGWYFQRTAGEDQTINVAYVYSGLAGLYCKCGCRNTPLKCWIGFEWAGPIAPPID